MVNLYYWRTNSGAEVDLLTEHAGALTGAYEIKWSRTVDTAHLSGLRSFQKDYPDVPCHVVCNADEPYRLRNVQVLNWKQFLQHFSTNQNILEPQTVEYYFVKS